MRFDNQFIDQLREKVVLTDVIGQKVILTPKGQESQGLCPFHKEKTPSFYVSNAKGTYYCFGCSEGGDVFKFLNKACNMSFVDAVQEVARVTHTPMPENKPDTPERAEQRSYHERIAAVCAEAQVWFQQLLMTDRGSKARRYMDERGIDVSTGKHFGVGYAPSGNILLKDFKARGHSEALLLDAGLIGRGDSGCYDRFRDRLIFPICDHKNRVIAFGGRAFGDAMPKYLNSPETPIFTKKTNLYNIQHALNTARQRREIIAVEGYMDVVALYKIGIHHAVAPMGTALTEEQIQKLWRLSPVPILSFDGDNAGLKAAVRAAEKCLPLLTPEKTLRFILLPAGEDPDTMIQNNRRSQLEEMYRHPVSLFDVLWRAHVLSKTMKSPEQKAATRQLFSKIIEQVEDYTLKAAYKQETRDRFYKLQRQLKDNIRTTATVVKSLDVHTRQKYILLACLLNHPELLNDVDNDLMNTTAFDQNADCLHLRDAILSWLSQAQTLDRESLHAYLIEQGFTTTIKAMLSESVLQHARFVNPSTEINQAREGWQDVYSMVESKAKLQQQHQTLRQSFSQSFDPGDWERIKTLNELKTQKTDIE